MPEIFSSITVTFRNLARSKIAIGAIAVLIVGVGGYFAFFRHAPTYQFVTVTKGSIIQTVSVTGNTTPLKSVSLGFQNSGTIAHVYRELGGWVNAGDIVAELNTANLSAALQGAQAAYNSTVASRSSQSLTETATQARNTYLSAYTALDTALHNSIDTFFGGPTVYGPQLLIIAPNNVELSKSRSSLTFEMQTYQQSLASASATDPSTLLANATTVARDISNFLDTLAIAANDTASGATATELTALATARTSVSTLLTTLSNARDTYLTKSIGATSLADANVEQAKAGIAAAEANFQGTRIVAPISGTITQQDAKVGQLASPGAPLVSIIGSGGFEADAGASETDIGKITIGDHVTMTLDAFPGETFAGLVFYIAPAQTNTQGVVSYQIKISFGTYDSRLKSGLTANIDIQTKHTDGVLILPQYAILQNNEGTFVETLVNGKVQQNPVTLGIADQKGNVEVTSGVTLGEQVLNIGLKAQ